MVRQRFVSSVNQLNQTKGKAMTQQPTQDSQSELRKKLTCIMGGCIGSHENCFYETIEDAEIGSAEETKQMVDMQISLIEAYVTTRVKEAEAEEVEMAADFAEDVLQQFGYNGKSGGLSTLEWAEGIIKRHKKLQALTTTTNGKDQILTMSKDNDRNEPSGGDRLPNGIQYE